MSCPSMDSKIFCGCPKIDIHFVPAQRFPFSMGLSFWTGIKHFLTCMPCPFTGPKMFCVGRNFLSQPKNLTAFSASLKPFELAQKTILLNANHHFVWHKMFVTAAIFK